MDSKNIPPRFQPAIIKILNLQKYDQYLGAYIFGSVARGETTKNSDLDLNIVTADDNPCSNINHPFIEDIKIDLNYLSISQLKKLTEDQIKNNERIPWMAECLIVFDKTGELQKLQKKVQKNTRKKATEKDYQFIQFMCYHADDKAKRNLKTDPVSALLALNININDILKFYYHINGWWWVSNKRLMPELREKDPKLASLLESFLTTSEVKNKYRLWTKILDHVLKPIGGRQKIEENNCQCSFCQEHINNLLKV